MTLSVEEFFEQDDALPVEDVVRLCALARPLLEKGIARRQIFPWELRYFFEEAHGKLHPRETEIVRKQASRFPEQPIAAAVGNVDQSRPTGGILLASSPRCGNSVLRKLLVHEGFVEVTAQGIHAIRWAELPDNFVLQCHVTAADASTFVEWARPRVITAVRHPLDTLLSAWKFAQHDDSPRHWIDGATELPATTTTSFTSWASSDGAKALLAVSASWVASDASIARYEEIQRDPQAVFSQLMANLDAPATLDDVQSVMDDEGERMGRHVWRKEPGAWKGLAPVDLDALETIHADSYTTLGYQRRDHEARH